ncbi:SrfA family protein [Acerihabitans sp. KWT182]|uniref:SrfA family protein n=1 Tax=Acerihabitans sp. KWT182 TaxID=3157919 RepID=A0AAU7Q4Y2_9GAMM
MAKSFLRSGGLNGILALGEDGLPVYASALQLRETLRLRGQQRLLDCLAIPQPNEQGDRLDWYSPIEGKVTSWAAASDSQRASALRQLESCRAAADEISARAQRAEKVAQKRFGMLLAKVMHFPDQNHVYLVGDTAVLTFWGFTKLNEKKPRRSVRMPASRAAGARSGHYSGSPRTRSRPACPCANQPSADATACCIRSYLCNRHRDRPRPASATGGCSAPPCTAASVVDPAFFGAAGHPDITGI